MVTTASITLQHQQAAFLDKLSMHQSCRNQSIPKLSTLVGGMTATRSLWIEWTEKENRQFAICTYESVLRLFESWLQVVMQKYDFSSLVLERIARIINQPVDQLSHWLSHVNDYQLNQFWNQLFAESAQGKWLKLLLNKSSTANQKNHGADADLFLELPSDALSVIAQGFSLVVSLLPDSSESPGILVYLPRDEGCDAVNQRALSELVHLVERVPIVPIGLMLSSTEANGLLTVLPESKSKAVFQSGWIEAKGADEESVRRWLCEHGLTQEKHIQSVVRIAQQYGATEKMLATSVAVLSPDTVAPAIDTDTSTFRSYPEWLLFQFLESRPETVGKFQANVQLDLQFGNHKMEVDFLAKEAKVVLELDGAFYHLQSPDNYRRDRRKDIQLQQAGYWVIRFLSEDVVAHLEEIFATIDQSLKLRLA